MAVGLHAGRPGRPCPANGYGLQDPIHADDTWRSTPHGRGHPAIIRIVLMEIPAPLPVRPDRRLSPGLHDVHTEP